MFRKPVNRNPKPNLMNPNRLIAYNNWANQRTFVSISDVTDSSDNRLKLFGHLIGANRLWLARLNKLEYGSEPYLALQKEVFPTWTVSECEAKLSELTEAIKTFMSSLTESQLADLIPFRDIRGNANQAVVEEILFNVVNHSTYHRGQIASRVRAAGNTPAITDYYVWLRELTSEGSSSDV